MRRAAWLLALLLSLSAHAETRYGMAGGNIVGTAGQHSVWQIECTVDTTINWLVTYDFDAGLTVSGHWRVGDPLGAPYSGTPVTVRPSLASEPLQAVVTSGTLASPPSGDSAFDRVAATVDGFEPEIHCGAGNALIFWSDGTSNADFNLFAILRESDEEMPAPTGRVGIGGTSETRAPDDKASYVALTADDEHGLLVRAWVHQESNDRWMMRVMDYADAPISSAPTFEPVPCYVTFNDGTAGGVGCESGHFDPELPNHLDGPQVKGGGPTGYWVFTPPVYVPPGRTLFIYTHVTLTPLHGVGLWLEELEADDNPGAPAPPESGCDPPIDPPCDP